MTSSGAIAQKTRKAIYAEMSLSAFAHHVKIGTQDREVTLQGPVRSGEEKSNIFTKGRRGRGRRQGHEQDRNNTFEAVGRWLTNGSRVQGLASPG